MKAAYLVGKEKVEIREAPVPVPGEDEVLIRVKRVGICGSDAHYYQEGRIGTHLVEGPYIVGHEVSGIVVESGGGVKKFPHGQKVAVDPGIPCGKCEVCLIGKPNICPNTKFLGTPPVPGAFCEYIKMPVTNIIPLPENLSLEEGALMEPLAIGLYAVQLLQVFAGETVAVFGCGPIGLSVLLCAKLSGVQTLIATDLIPERRNYAASAGADYVLNPKEADPVEKVMEITGGRGVKISFETSGSQKALEQAILSTSLAGRVAIVGIPSDDLWIIPAQAARRKELVLVNVRRSAFTAAKVVNLMATGKINAKGMITHHFPLERVADGLEMVAKNRDGVIKAMVDI